MNERQMMRAQRHRAPKPGPRTSEILWEILVWGLLSAAMIGMLIFIAK